MPAKKFVVPFASNGNKTAVPNTLQPDGTVSYAQGFGPDYELDKTVDPVNAKDVPRAQTNQLYYDLTDAVGEQQLYGVALWGADRAPYPLNARAYHTGKLWRSNVANNSGEPGVAGWDDVSNVVEEATQSQAEAGTAQGVYSSPLRVFQALRSAAANATELLRGVLRVGTQAEVNAGVLDDVAVTPKKLRAGFAIRLAENGYIAFPSWLGGLIIQWASGALDPANTSEPSQVIIYPISFPSAVLSVFVSTELSSASASADITYQTIFSSSLASVAVQRQTTGAANTLFTRPRIYAIGF